MTNQADALADRVEAGDGADRELDCLIAVACLGYFEVPPKWKGGPIGYGKFDSDGAEIHPGHGGAQLVPRFTASLDAAMTLVPEGDYWVRQDLWPDYLGRATASVCRLVQGDQPALTRVGQASSPARALTAAALRSRAQSAASLPAGEDAPC